MELSCLNNFDQFIFSIFGGNRVGCSLELIDLVMADTQLWIGFLIGTGLVSHQPDLIHGSRLFPLLPITHMRTT